MACAQNKFLYDSRSGINRLASTGIGSCSQESEVTEGKRSIYGEGRLGPARPALDLPVLSRGGRGLMDWTLKSALGSATGGPV